MPPTDILLPIYDYANGTPQKTQDALSLLLNEKSRIMALGIPAVEKIFLQAEKIYSEMGAKDPSKILTQVDMATYAYLDKETIEGFIKEPSNKETKAIFTIKMLFVTSALGLLDDANVFTSAELEKMDKDELPELSEEDDLFQKISYVKTLRYIITADDGIYYVSHLRKQVATAFYDQSQMTYDWEGAFLYSMILRTAWSCFHMFSTEDRQLLLESSLYVGIVSGTPLASILNAFFSSRLPANALERQEYIDLYLEFVSDNQETVPLDIENIKGKKLNEIVKNYIAFSGSNTVDGFNQKKFIDDLYGNQPGRDSYSRWLREAIAVVLHMRKGDWIPEVKS